MDIEIGEKHVTRISFFLGKRLLAFAVSVTLFVSGSQVLPANAATINLLVIQTNLEKSDSSGNSNLHTPISRSALSISDGSDLVDKPPTPRYCFLWFCFPRWERRIGRPAHRSNAGRRGKCNELKPSLIAIVPRLPITGENIAEASSYAWPENLNSALGFTVDPHPTFWVYIPSLPKSLEADRVNSLGADKIKTWGEFMLQDENDIDLFDLPIQVPLPQKSGVVGFRLSTHKLEFNRVYHWYFSIICNEDRPSRNPSVDGWIQLITLDLNVQKQLETATLLEQKAEVYAANGIWYEVLTILGERRCEAPREPKFRRLWSDLLKDGGFNQVAKFEVVGLGQIEKVEKEKKSLITCLTSE